MSDYDFDDDDGYIEVEADDVANLIEEQLKAFANRKIEPVPYEKKSLEDYNVCFVDSETDPFAPGVIVKPFSIGFYDQSAYIDFWGDDCVEQFFAYLLARKVQEPNWKPIIYAHNGGKFDFHFFTKYLDEEQSPLIMGARLVKIHFAGFEFRDSFAIIPEALKNANQKDEIDYNKFTRDRREKHRVEILAYQKSDVMYLAEVVLAFLEMFGDSLTVASASLRTLNSFHGFERFNGEIADEKFRQFYYGGRVQCFETGILRPAFGRKWRMVDRNSMYPAEMAEQLHPISRTFQLQRDIDEETDFACVDAWSDGALPVRADDGGLDFPTGRGTYYATIHEIRAGLDTGRLTIHRVKHAYKFDRKTTFADFVYHFDKLKREAEAAGDKLHRNLYKRNSNSSYGKFALNPRKFKQWKFTVAEIPMPQRSTENPDGWTLESQAGDMMIWSRPSPRKKGFINVATAASITGASRANLLRNLSQSRRPIYCDTDSILCEEFNGDIDPSRLGGWKVEAEGTLAAIAGKKLYALFNGDDVLKSASKGAKLSAFDIVRLAEGAVITWENEAPTFALGKEPTFIKRQITMTGK